ncbi:MAG: hypothetical protein GC162_03810 [Planctomycetes bacterium]|nr:hypothetical protein [Planctomycetota bacterium]
MVNTRGSNSPGVRILLCGLMGLLALFLASAAMAGVVVVFFLLALITGVDLFVAIIMYPIAIVLYPIIAFWRWVAPTEPGFGWLDLQFRVIVTYIVVGLLGGIIVGFALERRHRKRAMVMQRC